MTPAAEHAAPAAPWILTASGRRFDLLAPDPATVDPLDLAHALSNLCRFGGHTRVHYSVAQHSLLVSELAGRPFRLAGLLHDAAEAYVGDVVGPLARRMREFRDIERRILDAVAVRFGVPRWHLDTPEVRHADAVALLTERTSLLPPSSHPWAEDLSHARPLRRRIAPLAPVEARDRFLQRLHDLTTARPSR
jgi:5'-deoxynucleotidase YfbR-like HD superfamily hydrolase